MSTIVVELVTPVFQRTAAIAWKVDNFMRAQDKHNVALSNTVTKGLHARTSTIVCDST